MKKSVRNVTLFLFLFIVLGCGFAVLYLGTSTGLTFGGSGSRLQLQSKTSAIYAQVGWLKNTAPWPVTITNITTNVVKSAVPPSTYLETQQTSPTKQSGKLPNWALNAATPPYQLDGGSLRYLGFAMTPQVGEVASMTTITVDFTGPLGLTFHKTFGGTRVVASSSTLPDGLMGAVPYGNPGSLNDYITALRAALLQPDPKTIAAVMGNGATLAQAQAFITAHKGYASSDSVLATVVTKDGREQRVTFYHGSLSSALPAIEVIWSHYRWGIVPAST